MYRQWDPPWAGHYDMDRQEPRPQYFDPIPEEDQPKASWTIYESLLDTLTPTEQTALEAAACAQQCGRYQDAQDVFATRLPPAGDRLIVCLQMADLLYDQCLGPQQIELLEQGIEKLAASCTTSQLLLLKLMLADARCRVTGDLKQTVDHTAEARDHLRAVGIPNLSDIEIRCITIYYRIVHRLDQLSNYCKPEHWVIYDHYPKACKMLELKKIRGKLQEASRWRLVSEVMQMEIRYAQGGYSASEAKEACSILGFTVEFFDSLPLKVQSIVLRKVLADDLWLLHRDWSVRERGYYIKTLESLKDVIAGRRYDSWEEVVPDIAQGHAINEIKHSDASELGKATRMLDLALSAQQSGNLSQASVAFSTAIALSRRLLGWVKGSDEESTVVRAKLRAAEEASIDFHRTRTGNGLIISCLLANYCSTLSAYKEYETVLKLVADFETDYPECSAPVYQTKLYDQAFIAARAVGDKPKTKVFEERYLHWYRQTHAGTVKS